MPSALQLARGWLTKEEAHALVDSTPDPQERLLWILLLDLGLRITETQKPSIGDLCGPHVHVVGKKGRWRHLPTSTRLRQAATFMTTLPHCQYLTKAIPYRPRTIQARFRKALARAGIHRNGLCPHSLRHTYAMTLIDQGIPLPDVQALMGHANVATTSSYLHASPKHLERAANAIDSANGENPNDLETRL